MRGGDRTAALSRRWRAALEATSRTFHLSLRCVPKRRRTALSVGYLVARAADTLSDAGELPLEERRRGLRALRDALRGAPLSALPEVAGLDSGHRDLLLRAGELFELLERLPEELREPTRRVLRRLLRGMHLELEELARSGAVVRATGFQTTCWAFRAAGCVGAYWNELLALDLPPATPSERRERRRAAIRLGLGLQEVNLLRDVHEDAARGRRLLAGVEPSGRQPELEREWMHRARADLLQGESYVARLRQMSRRDRFAILLPARLGLATLDLLREERGRWIRGERLKIGRAAVRRAMVAALLDAIAPRRLRHSMALESPGSQTPCPA